MQAGRCRRVVVSTHGGPPSRVDIVRQCWLRTPDGPQPSYLYRKCKLSNLLESSTQEAVRTHYLHATPQWRLFSYWVGRLAPNSSLKFSGLSFMKNIKAWNSHNADVQVVKTLISRAADTLASFRVDDGHVACLGELDNQFLELPHLHSLVVLPTYTVYEGRFALHVGLAQLKALRAEPSIVYPPNEELSLYLLPSFLDASHPLRSPIYVRLQVTSTLALLVPGKPVTNVVLTTPWTMTRANEQVSELDDDDRANITWQDRRQLEELAAEHVEHHAMTGCCITCPIK